MRWLACLLGQTWSQRSPRSGRASRRAGESRSHRGSAHTAVPLRRGPCPCPADSAPPVVSACVPSFRGMWPSLGSAAVLQTETRKWLSRPHIPLSRGGRLSAHPTSRAYLPSGGTWGGGGKTRTPRCGTPPLRPHSAQTSGPAHSPSGQALGSPPSRTLGAERQGSGWPNGRNAAVQPPSRDLAVSSVPN